MSLAPCRQRVAGAVPRSHGRQNRIAHAGGGRQAPAQRCGHERGGAGGPAAGSADAPGMGGPGRRRCVAAVYISGIGIALLRHAAGGADGPAGRGGPAAAAADPRRTPGAGGQGAAGSAATTSCGTGTAAAITGWISTSWCPRTGTSPVDTRSPARSSTRSSWRWARETRRPTSSPARTAQCGSCHAAEGCAASQTLGIARDLPPVSSSRFSLQNPRKTKVLTRAHQI